MKYTEQDSKYRNLELMSTEDLLTNINREDQTVALTVEKCLPEIAKAVEACVSQLNLGGRIFYLGAGTSGRLGILDASECPPTFGVQHGLVIGLIAGGDQAIRKAVEFAEDNTLQGWKDLQEHQVSELDVVIGITASGSTPYVLGALRACNENRIKTVGICCNPNSALKEIANICIEAITGPEFLTGSTRMKAGTAQKLILNMITTASMIKIGRVLDNKMVDMQLSNHKLVDRGTKMIMEILGVDVITAGNLLSAYGSVRAAIKNHQA